MTICISVEVAEGLVFAADSAVVLQGPLQTASGIQQTILQTFEYASKVAQVKDYPIGVMTWGTASIRDRTVQSLVMEFEYGYPSMLENSEYSVKTIASDLVAFIDKSYQAAFQDEERFPIMGLAIGGYSSKSFFAEQYTVLFPDSKELDRVRPDQPDGKPSFGSSWFGQGDALMRLIKGYDPKALDDLIKRGVDKAIIQQWIDDSVPELPLIFDGMPLQDAIDFAEYAARVVIGRWRFGLGSPICGGEVDIAVIRPGSFKWARSKQWTIK